MPPELALRRAAPPAAFLLAVLLAFASSPGALRAPAGAGRWALLLLVACVGFLLLLRRREPADAYLALWGGFAAVALASSAWSIAPRHTLLHALTILILIGVLIAAAHLVRN